MVSTLTHTFILLILTNVRQHNEQRRSMQSTIQGRYEQIQLQKLHRLTTATDNL